MIDNQPGHVNHRNGPEPGEYDEPGRVAPDAGPDVPLIPERAALLDSPFHVLHPDEFRTACIAATRAFWRVKTAQGVTREALVAAVQQAFNVGFQAGLEDEWQR